MRKFGPKYIGRDITIQVLRAYILDLELSEEDTILLHADNYDALVLEHRAVYGHAIPSRFFLLGVFIDETDGRIHVPKDRVVVLYEDTRPERIQIAKDQMTLADDGRTIYRCRNCGRIVTPDGLLVEDSLRRQYINWLKVRGNGETVNVLGECCEREAR